MTNTDNAFVLGMLKQAEEQDKKLQKLAYGKRLTALLQRKGKLPMETKPTVGVSSFPKQANFANTLAAGIGGAAGLGAGLTSQMPLATTIAGAGLGGLAGAMTGGNADPNKSHRGRNALLGALAGGAAGYGAHRFSKDVAVPWIMQQGQPQLQGMELPASLTDITDIPKTAAILSKSANEELIAALQSYLDRAHEGIGHGVDKMKDLAYDGKEMLGRAGQEVGRGAMKATDYVKHNPGGSAAIGAGLGGLAGALTGKSKNKETGEGGTRGRNALIGALLGGGAGLAAHEYGVQPAEQALFKARTSGLPPRPEYTAEHSQDNPLRLLKQLGLAPLNVGQNAPPSSLSIKPRF